MTAISHLARVLSSFISYVGFAYSCLYRNYYSDFLTEYFIYLFIYLSSYLSCKFHYFIKMIMFSKIRIYYISSQVNKIMSK